MFCGDKGKDDELSFCCRNALKLLLFQQFSTLYLPNKQITTNFIDTPQSKLSQAFGDSHLFHESHISYTVVNEYSFCFQKCLPLFKVKTSDSSNYCSHSPALLNSNSRVNKVFLCISSLKNNNYSIIIHYFSYCKAGLYGSTGSHCISLSYTMGDIIQ